VFYVVVGTQENDVRVADQHCGLSFRSRSHDHIVILGTFSDGLDQSYGLT
jgi:hypothetical protein